MTQPNPVLHGEGMEHVAEPVIRRLSSYRNANESIDAMESGSTAMNTTVAHQRGEITSDAASPYLPAQAAPHTSQLPTIELRDEASEVFDAPPRSSKSVDSEISGVTLHDENNKNAWVAPNSDIALAAEADFKQVKGHVVDDGTRTNLGNTKLVMGLLADMWIIHLIVILGGTYCMTFIAPQDYTDFELWNVGCWWKIGWLFPLPYTFICFFGLVLPFRTPRFIYNQPGMTKRRLDNLYIVTVTKGDNREAVYRSFNAHKHLEQMFPEVRVHVLTDEPYFFENINCFTCPKSFQTNNSKYKARALEWYRQTMHYTEHDWILHLDEESVIDDESVKRVLEFIYYEKECTWGQGVILYNQYRYWTNPIFTVADALRVGDDLGRFHLQYTYFKRPVFGAHGSFLLTNGLVENHVTWDLGSLTEDYQFATQAWEAGFKCGKVPGFVREQSPMDLMGFMKQRRRWYVGIRRLPGILPKIWNAFWTLGILCLYGTIISIVLGFVMSTQTPRWFGLLKDFSFCTFVYLYILGIFTQDMDKKAYFWIPVRLVATAILQFVAVVMEALAVMYALVFPPSDFDVIKK